MSDETLSPTEIACIVAHYDGLEMTWVDDEIALSCTVGDVCRSHETLRVERDRSVTLIHAVLAVAVARRAIYEYLPAKVREALDKLIPPCDESREDRWLRLGYRVEWSEREPRMYEVRCLGSLPADNTCLARLRTVQEVDAWIAEHTNPGEFA